MQQKLFCLQCKPFLEKKNMCQLFLQNNLRTVEIKFCDKLLEIREIDKNV